MAIMNRIIKSQRFARIAWMLIASMLILFGIAALLKGHLGYYNYWNGLVFAPYAIVLGTFVCFLALFRWRKLSQKPKRLKGRAARRERQASEYRSTISDYNKPWSGGV